MRPGIQPFIFCADGQFVAANKIYDQLRNLFARVTVLNSDAQRTHEGWIDIPGGGGGALFQRAVDLFSSDIMLCIHADAQFKDYLKLMDDAQAFLSRYDAGVYAPNVTPSWWKGESTDIPSNLIEHPNLRLVAATGEAVMFVRKEVVHGFAERNLRIPSDLPHGAIDIVLSCLAYAKGMPVLRDCNHIVTRGDGGELPGPSMLEVMDRLETTLGGDLRKLCSLVREDPQGLIRYISKAPEVPRVLGTRVDYLLGSLELKRIPRFFDLSRYPTFVETGTFKGAGVQWALEQGFQSIYSVEISQPIFDAAVAKFQGQRRVKVRLGDSKIVLPQILKEIEGPALFYLDSHCSGRFQGINTGDAPEGLPLQQECLALMEYRDIHHSLIVVDDERLMIDPPGPASNFGSAIKTWLFDNWCGKLGFHATFLDDALIFEKSP